VDVAAYLTRIGHRSRNDPTLGTLRALHRQHLLSVPFENLDIHLGRPIELREEAIFGKVVRARRGGFCYELNGLFGWLLDRIGFAVATISARVTTGGRMGPEFDHLALIVQLGGSWLVDVGFGRSFAEPLELLPGRVLRQDDCAYRIDEAGGTWSMWERDPARAWSERYRFTLAARRLDDFAAMCRHHQTSPDSSFTRERVCSRLTPDGRLTLTEDRLIEAIGGERRVTPVMSDARYRELLRERFGIDLHGAPWRATRP